jgi:hypothetical protein
MQVLFERFTNKTEIKTATVNFDFSATDEGLFKILMFSIN